MGKGSLQLSSATFGSELGNLVGFLSHRGNRGNPKSSRFYVGFSIINHPAMVIPHLWKPPYVKPPRRLRDPIFVPFLYFFVSGIETPFSGMTGNLYTPTFQV